MIQTPWDRLYIVCPIGCICFTSLGSEYGSCTSGSSLGSTTLTWGRGREREKEGEGEGEGGRGGGRRRGRGMEKGEGEGEINLSYTRACWPPWVQSQESATVYHLGRREYWQLFLCTWSGRGFLGPLLPVGSWGSMIFTLIPSTPEENTSA